MATLHRHDAEPLRPTNPMALKGERARQSDVTFGAPSDVTAPSKDNRHRQHEKDEIKEGAA